jgi:WD40 repeat protein
VHDADSGAVLAELPSGPLPNQVVAWHPDGERLAVTGSEPRIQVWNVAARRKVATLEGHVQHVSTVTFHPDGELLASHGWDGQLLLWHVSSGRQLMRLTAVHPPHFSADGRSLGVVWHGDRAELLEVTQSREYRTLTSSRGTGLRGYNHADFSPDGRVLAVGMNEGTCLWDLRTGREVAVLPAGTTHVGFDGRGRAEEGPAGPPWALLTSGTDGLQRWPAASLDPAGQRVRLGPPRQLSPLKRAWFSHGPDGRTLGVASEEGGVNQILDLETGAVRRELARHPNGDVRVVSGDGRWAASSGWHSDRVRLWDARTGETVEEWVLGMRGFVFFTPDSRTLVIARGDEFTFVDVQTRQPTLRLRRDVAHYPGHVAFSPDGLLMAVEMAPAVIHLKEVATGRTVARFEDPHGDRAAWQGFTPDGTRLVVVSSRVPAINVWDLPAVRARLTDMNLDWEWPAFPPAAPGDPSTESMTVEVVPGPRLTPALTPEQKAQRDIDRWRRQVEAHPDAAHPLNLLAWEYLTAPGALRDATAALPLARKAVQMAPENAYFVNTLGVAYYRTGRYREAVETLRPNLDRQRDAHLGFDLYFLAMSHHRLGEAARARDYYAWAVRWAPMQRDLGSSHLEELAAFRAEAEDLLGIPWKKD